MKADRNQKDNLKFLPIPYGEPGRNEHADYMYLPAAGCCNDTIWFILMARELISLGAPLQGTARADESGNVGQ